MESDLVPSSAELESLNSEGQDQENKTSESPQAGDSEILISKLSAESRLFLLRSRKFANCRFQEIEKLLAYIAKLAS